MRLAFEQLERRARGLDRPTEVDGALFVVERSRTGSVRIERIVWCGGAEAELETLGRTNQLLTLAAQLLGGPVMDQLINQAHVKQPGDGVAFDFHQDSYHRRYGTPLFHDVNGRGSFVQALTAVDAASPENGGLWVVPESHRGGHIPTSDGRLPGSAFDVAKALPIPLAPGDTLLLGPFTVHGSGPNLGRSARRLFINGFCCPGANRRDYFGAGTGCRVRACDSAA